MEDLNGFVLGLSIFMIVALAIIATIDFKEIYERLDNDSDEE